MHINDFHVPDCPQFRRLLSPLSAHQLPEINMQTLISTLLFNIKQSFLHNTTFTLYHWSLSLIYFASHSPLAQADPSHPSLLFLLSLHVLLYPPFLLWTLWGERWINRLRREDTYKKVTMSRLFNYILQIRYATIHVISDLLYLSAFRSRNPRRAHLSLLTHYISVAK